MTNFYVARIARAARCASLRRRATVLLILLLFSLAGFAQGTVEKNTLPNGDYYIKIRGTDEYVTRDPNVETKAPYEAYFMYSRPAAADRSLQRFNITKQSNGRYTIRLHNPGINDGYLVEWWEVFWATGFSPDHHTFNVFKKDNAYAFQTDGLITKSFFAFNTDVRKRLINEGLLTTDPVSFLFELIPYNAALAETNLTMPAIPVKQVGSPNFSPGAASNSAAAITYSSSNTNVAVIESGQVKIVGPGTTIITATQAANGTHNAGQASRALKVDYPASSLVARYTFDNSLNDAANNNPIQAFGDVTYVAGKDQNAIQLDGSDFLALPMGIANHDNITIATAIKLNSNPSWSRIFDFGNDRSNYMFLTTSMGNEGKIRFAIKANNGVEQFVTSTQANVIPNDTWTHLAVSLSAAGQLKIYVNGVAIPTEQSVTPLTMKASDLGNTTQNMISNSHFPDNYLNAAIDEFRIYNYAMTDAEVLQLANSVLPVDLVSFNAKKKSDGTVNLQWETASETNNASFIIEKSSDNKDFSVLSTVEAKGKASVYSYDDLQPANGYNYYRLSQVDNDGSRKELGIKTVIVSLVGDGALRVAPNPVEGSTIRFETQEVTGNSLSVKIFDTNGREVFTSLLAKNSSGSYSVIADIAPGLYILKVNNTSTRLIKK